DNEGYIIMRSSMPFWPNEQKNDNAVGNNRYTFHTLPNYTTMGDDPPPPLPTTNHPLLPSLQRPPSCGDINQSETDTQKQSPSSPLLNIPNVSTSDSVGDEEQFVRTLRRKASLQSLHNNNHHVPLLASSRIKAKLLRNRQVTLIGISPLDPNSLPSEEPPVPSTPANGISVTELVDSYYDEDKEPGPTPEARNRKREAAVSEILTTERKYVDGLEKLVNIFLLPLREICQKTSQKNGLLSIKPIASLEDISILFDEAHPDFIDLQKCVRQINIIADEVNEKMRDAENQQKVLEIQLKVDNIPDIINPARRFIHSGDLYKVTPLFTSTKPYFSSTQEIRTHFLFNDLLLFCSNSQGGKLTYRGQLDLNNCSIIDIDDDASDKPFCFQLITKTAKGDLRHTVRTNTGEEKAEWMGKIEYAISSLQHGIRISYNVNGKRLIPIRQRPILDKAPSQLGVTSITNRRPSHASDMYISSDLLNVETQGVTNLDPRNAKGTSKHLKPRLTLKTLRPQMSHDTLKPNS
ncbi:8339_t:CDS:2, partial [Racocetra persica]